MINFISWADPKRWPISHWEEFDANYNSIVTEGNSMESIDFGIDAS